MGMLHVARFTSTYVISDLHSKGKGFYNIVINLFPIPLLILEK